MVTIAPAPERRFYHSFPRRQPADGADAVNREALAILRAVKEIGIVLAPEVVQWSIPQIDGTQKVIRNRQVRICFTELSQPELSAHSETFGEFSLEFDVDVLRRLGVLPVIYVPQMAPGDTLLSSFGPVIVWMFENARGTLDLLDQLAMLSNPERALDFARQTNPEVHTVAPEYTIQLSNQNEKGERINPFEVRGDVVRRILDFLNYRTAPFALMRGAIWAAQNLFYPTDDQVNDCPLSYYRQREWRIIPGMTVEGRTITRSLTESEKQRLLAIDTPFWIREIADDKGTFKRIDEAQVIDNYRGQHVTEFIRRALVPNAAYDMAHEILGDIVAVLE